MGKAASMGARRSVRRVALGVVGGLTLWMLGCEEGMPPTQLIDGDAPDHLPPGVTLGTQVFIDSLYRFDRTRFQIYFIDRDPKIPTGTDLRFVKRGELLSIINDPNQADDLPMRPDQIPDALGGDVLRNVYSKPYLFGFESGDASTDGFEAGQTFAGTESLLPITSGGETWWDYNHVELQWARVDTVVQQVSSPTSMGGPEWLVRARCSIGGSAPTDAVFFPRQYNQDVVMSVLPGRGIFVHGWTLVAERDDVLWIQEGQDPVFDCEPELVPVTEPRPQRNPRFLWASKGQIGEWSTSEPVFTSIDQCVDGLWGELEFFPVQLAGGDVRVGERYVTDTYITADSAAIRRRARGPVAAALEGVDQTTACDSLRCIGVGVDLPDDVPVEVDNPAFPKFHLSLLARYEVSVERMFDQLVWRAGSAAVGRYGEVDGVIDVVKLVVRVIAAAPEERLVQRLDMYLMRDVGVVVQQAGIDPNRILVDTSRLRRAAVNGVFFDELAFCYCRIPDECPAECR